MVDPSIAKTLPDNALIAASKGGGGIPSWLALSELQSRNNIRSSAPIQQPQSTVADDVVSEALRSSGIMGPAQSGQMPMSPQGITAGPQQAQPQQQIPQQPQSMAKGGPVRMADGGYADMLEHSGFLAPLPNIQANPINYTPAVTPDGTTLESASGRVSPLFGKGPDYSQAMSDLAELKKKSPNTSDLGHWLSNFAGAALASKGNAVQGFGQGLMTANAAQDEAKQREFENSRQIGSDSMGIQMHQDERQRSIANSVTKYQESQAGIADAQARMRASIDSGNRDNALDVQKELANLAQKRVDAIQDFTKSMSNPTQAGFIRDMALKNGNQPLADLAGHSIDNFNAQAQKSSDLVKNREMDVARAQGQARMNQIGYEKQLDFNNKRKEMAMNMSMMGLSPKEISDATGINTQPAASIGRASNPSAPDAHGDIQGIPSAHGNDVDQPPSKLDVAALNWLKTENTGIGMRGGTAAYNFNQAAMGRAANKLMPQYGLTADDLTGVRAAYKGANGEYQKLSNTMGPILSAENTINNQLPQLVGLAKKLQSVGMDLNSKPDEIKRALGAQGYQALNDALVTIPDEYASVISKGQPTDQTRSHGAALLNRSLSGDHMDESAQQMIFEMEQRKQGYIDELANARYRMSMPSLVSFVKKGAWTDDPNVVERKNLPEGKGANLDPVTAKKFLQAAANKIGAKDIHSPEVEKEAANLAKIKGFGGF